MTESRDHKTKQYSPATGEELPPVPETDPSLVSSIVARAREVQSTVWASTPFAQRATHIRKVQRYLKENADRGVRIISQCNGKAHQEALVTEIISCIAACDWYASNAAKVLKPEKLKSANVLTSYNSSVLEYSPVGVVGIISPWNYPFSIPFGEIIMGLMAGNAIILKVATPVTLVGMFIADCIAAGGFPDGLFTHIVVPGAQAGPLLLSAGVNKIFFTGSVAVGKQLMKEAAATLTPLSLELGGKDPMIVLEDADLERATNCACWGGLTNAGQSCAGVERVYVHEKVYDAFLEMLCAKVRSLRHGPPSDAHDVDIGAITTKGQLKVISSQVDDAVANGARIVAQSRPVGNVQNGTFYPATVLINVNHAMRIMREENFGPVLPVMKFSTIDEAVQMANDSTLALTASIHTKNLSYGKRIASRIEAGTVTINDHLSTHGQSESPWGGWKETGLGRTHGSLGLKEMSNVRCVNTLLIPPRWMPRNLWWYPYSPESFRTLSQLPNILVPRNMFDWVTSTLRALPSMAKALMHKWNIPKQKSE